MAAVIESNGGRVLRDVSGPAMWGYLKSSIEAWWSLTRGCPRGSQLTLECHLGYHFTQTCRRSSAAEQGTHKPLAGGSIPPVGTR